MIAALKTRLVWLLLALTLCQAWGAARHLHGLERLEGPDPAASDAAAAQSAASAGQDWLAQAWPVVEETASGRTPSEETTGEAECHCLWCAPRLHTVLAYALPVPGPPALAPVLATLPAAPGFAASPAPRGTVPPPRGPPA